MRWLVFMGIVATAACTRLNPSYGDGGSTGGGTSNDDDPSASASASASADDDDDGSASMSASADDDANPDSGLDGTETGGNARPCCVPHSGIGCEDASVEECVCSQVPDCCAVEWNDHCSQKARECGGACGVVDDGPLEESTSIPPMTSDDSDSATDGSTSTSDGGSSTGTTVDGDCCTTHDDPGCSDDKAAACVCESLPQCCEEGWTKACVDQVAACAFACPI